MELLSPAGNVQKLYYAYSYGADAAYIGLKKFSLRAKADNFYGDEFERVAELKKQFPQKKLYCALNILFHNHDIDLFLQNIEYFKNYPIDSFIVQDLGIVPILQKHFPQAALHLSTQASCINREAAKMYKSLGFKRIVLGRETSLAEIRQIKDAVPEMELEAFVHGAMCVAYSGRCLLSAYLTNRSAQHGFCSHTCRWNFDLKSKEGAEKLAQSGELFLEEENRKGEFFPIFEGENFTAILSSKDLQMIDHLADMKAAGIDALKIEGRMKSVYYTALVTRAYRKAIDALEGKISDEEAAPFVAELANVSHRESTTGFYYDSSEANKTASGASDSAYDLAATIQKKLNEEEATEIFSKGETAILQRQAELSALHPEAKKAREKDFALHPEKAPPAITKRAGWFFYKIEALNLIQRDSKIEFVAPNFSALVPESGSWLLADLQSGLETPWTSNGHETLLYTKYDLPESAIIRAKDDDFVPNAIRDFGRSPKKRI